MDSILVGKYEGEYQNGRYHGKGKITFGKNTYEGTFFNGQMHGEGKMTVAGKSTGSKQRTLMFHQSMSHYI